MPRGGSSPHGVAVSTSLFQGGGESSTLSGGIQTGSMVIELARGTTPVQFTHRTAHLSISSQSLRRLTSEWARRRTLAVLSLRWSNSSVQRSSEPQPTHPEAKCTIGVKRVELARATAEAPRFTEIESPPGRARSRTPTVAVRTDHLAVGDLRIKGRHGRTAAHHCADVTSLLLADGVLRAFQQACVGTQTRVRMGGGRLDPYGAPSAGLRIVEVGAAHWTHVAQTPATCPIGRC